MRIKMLFPSLLVVGLLLGAVAQEQPGQPTQREPGRFGAGFQRGGMGLDSRVALLQRPDVQAELKITDEQKAKLGDLRQKAQERMRARFQELQGLSPEERRQKATELMASISKETEKELAAVLNADQMKRLKELALQQEGPMALARPEVAKEVGLTSEQQSKVQGIIQEMRASMRPAGPPGQGGPPSEERLAQIRAAREKAQKAIEALLTDEQKQKWQSMLGKPFKFQPQQGGGRGAPPG